MYQNFIIPYLYEAQHVSGETPPIIRNQNCTGSFWFFIRGRLLDVQLVSTVCLTTTTNYTSNNLPRMKNQRLPVRFQAPDDGRCVARNMLSFILIWNNRILIHCCILLDFFYEYLREPRISQTGISHQGNSLRCILNGRLRSLG